MGRTGFVNDYMGSPVATPPATNKFVMPQFEDGSSYAPGDPVYDAVAEHFTPEVWNGLEEEARWSVIETLEESLPTPTPVPDEQPPRRSGGASNLAKQLDMGANKARMPFGPPDLKGLFGGKRRGK
jgi:hypothetical protein